MMNMNEEKAILMLIRDSPHNHSKLVILKDSNDGIECYKYNIGNKQPESVGYRGVRCTLVGSTLYFIGGQDTDIPFFRDTRMSFIDTSNSDDGWKSFELPFYASHVKVVVWRNFIYLFPRNRPFFYKGVDRKPSFGQDSKTPSQPYIYDTVKKQGYDIPLPTLPSGLRVLPPWYQVYKVCYNDEFWEHFFPGFRVCAAWEDKGLLISVFGDEKFYLHVPNDEPDLGWRPLPFKPLPKFRGSLPCKEAELSLPTVQSLSAVINATLYCCDIPDPSEEITDPILHVYNLNEGSVEFSHDLPCLSPGYMKWNMLALADGELSFIGYLNDSDDYGKFIYLKVKVSKESAKVVKDVSFDLPYEIREDCSFMLIDTRQLQIDIPGNNVERIEARLLPGNKSQQPELEMLEAYEMKIQELEEQLQEECARSNDSAVVRLKTLDVVARLVSLLERLNPE